ncbi:uncharacterized protein [Dermacentor albipictus]|uniref:uncharacterized protein isoform X2 n=1 Tax=Dermacentor albipictus TaxID=60249 RepID=UPI0031FCEEF0
MAGKETAGPHFTMSSGSCNVDQGTSSAATDLIHGSGVSTIPVALVPTNGGSIRITNPQAVQKALKATSNHFQTITDVRAFGRGGIVCRSPDQTCVEDLLKCTSFASTPSSRRNQRSSVAPAREPGGQQNARVPCLPVRFHRHGDLPKARR